MKEKLNKAIEANDIVLVKEIVIDAVTNHAGRRETLELVAVAVEKAPHIFVEDDGEKFPADSKYWTETLKLNLREKLKNNFSREKLKLFTEISSDITTHPEKERSEYGEVVPRQKGKSQNKVGKIIGYSVMCVGIVAAIVGLCIPLRLLLGLGIGVFMIGSGITYTALK